MVSDSVLFLTTSLLTSVLLKDYSMNSSRASTLIDCFNYERGICEAKEVSKMEDTARVRILEYIKTNLNGSSRINISELSKQCGVSRQRIWQLLEKIGETRHKRIAKKATTCQHCGVLISRYATNCKRHAKVFKEKKEGSFYQCRICKEYKLLERFSKNKSLKSGYENRCLVCRAAWQREYSKTSKGKNTNQYNKTFLSHHPERIRAYYQVNRAIKNGTLIKPSQCSEPNCIDSRVVAIHKDYFDPLNVIWLCKLHSLRTNIDRKEYRPNLFEEDFRSFVFLRVGHYNSPGRWLAAIKKHYQITSLSSKLFRTAYEEHKSIDGLGPRFRKTAQEYLKSRGY